MRAWQFGFQNNKNVFFAFWNFCALTLIYFAPQHTSYTNFKTSQRFKKQRKSFCVLESNTERAFFIGASFQQFQKSVVLWAENFSLRAVKLEILKFLGFWKLQFKNENVKLEFSIFYKRIIGINHIFLEKVICD